MHWGEPYSVMSEYSPYRHAEELNILYSSVIPRKIMKNEMFVLVLVKFPWYNNRISSFIDADHVYYRGLASRTFCGYLNDGAPMNTIVSKFSGAETVYGVPRHLAGIIFIGDNIIKEDSYSCNVIMNLNALNNYKIVDHYLMSFVEKGDKRGLYDDLRFGGSVQNIV